MQALNRWSRLIGGLGRGEVWDCCSGPGLRFGVALRSINAGTQPELCQDSFDRPLVIEQVGFLIARPLAVHLFFDMGIGAHVDDVVDACGRPR